MEKRKWCCFFAIFNRLAAVGKGFIDACDSFGCCEIFHGNLI